MLKNPHFDRKDLRRPDGSDTSADNDGLDRVIDFQRKGEGMKEWNEPRVSRQQESD